MADGYIRAHYAGAYSNLSVIKTDATWSVSVEAASPTRFASIFGIAASTVSVESAATFTLNTYEIGLVVDTTGSMAGEKMEQLKSAATQLVDTMSASVSDADAVKLALVPFSSFVNVGPQFGPQFNSEDKIIRDAAPWLDMEGKNPIEQVELDTKLSRFELFHHLGQNWSGCVETRPAHKNTAYDVMDIPGTSKDRR